MVKEKLLVILELLVSNLPVVGELRMQLLPKLQLSLLLPNKEVYLELVL